jgi:hypothetical protein
VCRRKATIIASSGSVKTVERGSLEPDLRSSIVSRLRRLAIVLTLTPSSRFSVVVVAPDLFIAALTACVPSHGLLRKPLPVSGAWLSRDELVP